MNEETQVNKTTIINRLTFPHDILLFPVISKMMKRQLSHTYNIVIMYVDFVYVWIDQVRLMSK